LPSGTLEFLTLTNGMYIVLLMIMLAFTVISRSVLQDSIRIRMSEVSNQVAGYLIEAYSLCYQTKSDTVQIYRLIDIPAEIGVYGYVINVKLENDTWVVETHLETTEFTFARSPLWKRSNTTYIETGNGTIFIGGHQIGYDSVLHSGSSKAINRPVVWAVKSGDTVRVGIGVLKS